MTHRDIQKACIYGAGAIGGWLGAGLAAAGCSVSVVARGATLEALHRHGLRVQKTVNDSFQWDTRFGAGQDVFDALVRQVDRIDDSYKN